MSGISSFVPGLRRIGEPQMCQPALQTFSPVASVGGGLLWACLAPVFV